MRSPIANICAKRINIYRMLSTATRCNGLAAASVQIFRNGPISAIARNIFGEKDKYDKADWRELHFHTDTEINISYFHQKLFSFIFFFALIFDDRNESRAYRHRENLWAYSAMSNVLSKSGTVALKKRDVWSPLRLCAQRPWCSCNSSSSSSSSLFQTARIEVNAELLVQVCGNRRSQDVYVILPFFRMHLRWSRAPPPNPPFLSSRPSTLRDAPMHAMNGL